MKKSVILFAVCFVGVPVLANNQDLGATIEDDVDCIIDFSMPDQAMYEASEDEALSIGDAVTIVDGNVVTAAECKKDSSPARQDVGKEIAEIQRTKKAAKKRALLLQLIEHWSRISVEQRQEIEKLADKLTAPHKSSVIKAIRKHDLQDQQAKA